jgi:hypothetical protein
MRIVKKTGQGPEPDWYVNLDAIVAARVMDVTVRGHSGNAEQATEVRLFLPIAAQNGETTTLAVVGEEAEQVIELLERQRRAAA